MKKKTINAFTLVEMLIVIVIIGILIAALMPRMQAAQGRARDVSRKTALSQVQSAIVTSQGDKGAWPGMPKNNAGLGEGKAGNLGLDLDDIKPQLEAAGMNGVPEDPLKSEVKGIGDSAGAKGQYRYIVVTRNGTPAGGFVLMAKTEVEGGSNYVVCGDDQKITSETDITKTDSFRICTSIKKAEGEEVCTPAIANEGKCIYKTDDQLRYVVVY